MSALKTPNNSKARRLIDVEKEFKKVWPDVHERKLELLKEKYEFKDDFFKSSRGLSHGTRTIIPPQDVLEKKHKTGIFFVHGYDDNLRWNPMKTLIKLAEEGFLVTGMEHEGHGLSDTKNGLIKDMKLVRDDLHEFIKYQQKKFGDEIENWFLFGSSMGGMIAIMESLKAKESDEIKLNGMILVSPACKIGDDIKPNPVAVKLLLGVAKVFPSLAVTPTSMDSDLCFKEEWMRKRAKLDPIVFKGKPRLATAATIYKTTLWLGKNLHNVNLPFFVIHGTDDVVSPVEGSRELYEKSKLDEKDKEIFIAEGAWHGLLHCEPEEEMKVYWEKILTWIDEKCIKDNE